MEKIKVLLIEPMEEPRLVEVEDTLEELQRLVGGSIAATYPWKDPVAIVFNDNGVAEWLQPNRVLEEYNDILLGSFFICGLGEESFESLPEDLIIKYTEKYRWPETFKRSEDGKMRCIRVTDHGIEMNSVWE